MSFIYSFMRSRDVFIYLFIYCLNESLLFLWKLERRDLSKDVGSLRMLFFLLSVLLLLLIDDDDDERKSSLTISFGEVRNFLL